MGRIQSNVGLITGVPIQQTVDQLMALQAVPRDRLLARQRSLQAQQAALTDLTAAVLGVQFAARRLKSVDLFQQRTVASSNASLLTGTAAPAVPAGQYQFVAVRQTQTHHATSSGISASDAALGGGSFSFRFGGHVDQGLNLSELNAGQGVAAGKIRITDRSGASAIVDLRYVRTIDDVLAAINSADGAEVEAVAVGDRLRLIDNSGGAGNLRVQEVNGGTTAADLGLAGINVAADSADGADVVSLFDGFDLGRLNDDNGVALLDELPDIQVTFRDNSAALSIDLNPSGDDPPRTLGDIIDRLNAADPTRLQASISADGKRIELTDLTTNNGGTFAVTSLLGGSAAEDLGLTESAAGDTISGRRLITGLKTTLLGTLAGGDGLGPLGDLDLTDRTGASATVSLAGAETLADVIDAINAAGLEIRAEYNASRNGIALVDISGQTASNLIAADGDATDTATKLGLAASVAADQIDSGSLDRQVVSRSTLLSSYGGGEGVGQGSFLITNSNGQSAAVNLTVLQPETVGDVIDAINGLAIGVTASINDAGDGILLTDTAGGPGLMSVADVGAGHAAKDLRLAGQATGTTIDGSTTFTIQLDAGDTLEDLVEKINDLGGGATASIFSEQSGSLRHHLSLLSGVAGKSGELLIDGSGLELTFRDIASAQDALLQVGAGSTFGGQLISSVSNAFDEVLPGLDVTLHGQSDDPVTLTVGQSVESVSGAIQTFVDLYNKLREKLDTYTAFNESDGTKGTLFGSSETLRLDADLARLVTGQFFGVGNVRSLAELGVSIDDRGRLSFSKTKLEERYAEDPEGVQAFFADETRGFGAKVDALIETLAGPGDSALVTRVATLQRRIEDAERRIDLMTARLDRNRERLLLQFFRTEEIVARMQNNLTAISQIQYIPPVQITSQQQ
jgi:flagellar hook-associated protein 2